MVVALELEEGHLKTVHTEWVRMEYIHAITRRREVKREYK